MLPMTYIERKLRGDTTLAIIDGRIYEPDYMEDDMSNFLVLGNTKTAMIDGPSVHKLEDLWETTYRKDLDEFMEAEIKKVSPEKIRGTKLGEEIIKTELKHFIVFNVFRKFVSDPGKLAKALGKIKAEYKEQEDEIQSSINRHIRGDISDVEIENYRKRLMQEKPERHAISLASKIAKRMGNFNEETDTPRESVPEIAEDRQKDCVFLNTFDFDMLVIDDLVFWIEEEKRKKADIQVNGKNYSPVNTPAMQVYELIDNYREKLEKKFKDLAFFSQPRLKKLRDMQLLIEEELSRDVYKEKRLEIAETGRPDVMFAVMGFGEFVNKGCDGNYFLFPPGKVAVMIEWRNGSAGNSQPVIWGDYYAPNIPGGGQHKTTLCLAGYDNENKRMDRGAKIADYLAHAVRTMQQGYIPGQVNVYHSLSAQNELFRKLKISKSEMERRGLKSLNIP